MERTDDDVFSRLIGRPRLQEDRLSFVAQGPLDAIMRCLKGGRAAQQQCALDALTTVRCAGSRDLIKG